jgi:DNA-binding MarR family transcriptional regulator
MAQSRVLRAIEPELSAAGAIPITWYDVLLELNSAEGRCLRMQQLAMRVVLSRTRVSRLVAELEEAGLVNRMSDSLDGRATLATITDEGRKALRRAAPIYLAGIEKYFTRHLTEHEQRVIARGLQRVIDSHDALIDPRR